MTVSAQINISGNTTSTYSPYLKPNLNSEDSGFSSDSRPKELCDLGKSLNLFKVESPLVEEII